MLLGIVASVIAFILFVPWLLIVFIPVGALMCGGSYCVLKSSEGIKVVQKDILENIEHYYSDESKEKNTGFVYSNAS